MENARNLFDLTGRVAVITGGTGLLGQQHAEAIARAGGIPVLADIRVNGVDPHSQAWKERFGEQACAIQTDITDPGECQEAIKDCTGEVRPGRYPGQ